MCAGLAMATEAEAEAEADAASVRLCAAVAGAGACEALLWLCLWLLGWTLRKPCEGLDTET